MKTFFERFYIINWKKIEKINWKKILEKNFEKKIINFFF